MGLFIVFEGSEGSGKSTQSRMLYQFLKEKGYKVILTREPGGTPLGDVLRPFLKTSKGLDPLSELFLFASARAQLVKEVIAPTLERHEIVICDRFAQSTVAYQGGGRRLNTELINRVNQEATTGIEPDIVVLLDQSVEVGLNRKEKILDAFEMEDMEFHQRVRESYLTQASENPEKWVVLDATRSQSSLSKEIWDKVILNLQNNRG